MHHSFRKCDIPNRERGVSIIETLIVVAVIGIATTLAIPMYQIYTIRAQISQGLVLSGTHKLAVASFHHDNGAFPANNAHVSLAPPTDYASNYVASISIDGAEVAIQYGNKAHQQITGRTVTLSASDIVGSVQWSCSSGGAIPDDQMPPACR